MNITCSDAIQMDSMIRNKWHDDGDDDVMISRINWWLTELDRWIIDGTD